jgi:hypothetical protein
MIQPCASSDILLIVMYLVTLLLLPGTQALVPAAGSNHSSLSAEDHDLSPVSVPATTTIVGPVIGKARALVDYTPSPYDKDALRFKVRRICME